MAAVGDAPDDLPSSLNESPLRGRRWLTSPALRLLAATCPAIVVLAVGAVSYRTHEEERASRVWVAHTRDVTERAQLVLVDLLNAETGQRGFLLTGDDRYLEPYHAGLRALDTDTVALRKLTADNPAQQRRLDTLYALALRRAAVLDTIVAIRRADGLKAAVAKFAMGRGKVLMDSVRTTRDRIAHEEVGRLEARLMDESRHAERSTAVLVGGAALSAMLALLANVLLGQLAARVVEEERLVARHARNLARTNEALRAQEAELEESNAQLQDQASELETNQGELEALNQQLQEQQRDMEVLLETEQSARSDAERANQAKAQFLTMMSHELRTPLNAIAGYAELLDMGLRGAVTDAQREDLARIRRSGQHLLSLINDILNFAKLEAGRVELTPAVVHSTAIMAEVDALIAPQVQVRRIEYRRENVEDCVLWADGDKVQQVLLNLLSNAMKFTEPRGTINVSCTVDGDAVRFLVSDTGRGIPPEKREHIFEPFIQVDRHLTHASQQGVGLGLTISRDLAQAMGGDLTLVQTEVGVGTTFAFTVPRAGARSSPPSDDPPVRTT